MPSVSSFSFGCRCCCRILGASPITACLLKRTICAHVLGFFKFHQKTRTNIKCLAGKIQTKATEYIRTPKSQLSREEGKKNNIHFINLATANAQMDPIHKRCQIKNTCIEPLKCHLLFVTISESLSTTFCRLRLIFTWSTIYFRSNRSLWVCHTCCFWQQF